MRETLKDFAIGDKFTTQHQGYRDEALNAFYKEVDTLKMTFEHMINDDYGVVIVENAQFVGKQLDKLDELAFLYNYKADDNELYEYDFREEVRGVKYDDLGFGA